MRNPRKFASARRKAVKRHFRRFNMFAVEVTLMRRVTGSGKLPSVDDGGSRLTLGELARGEETPFLIERLNRRRNVQVFTRERRGTQHLQGRRTADCTAWFTATTANYRLPQNTTNSNRQFRIHVQARTVGLKPSSSVTTWIARLIWKLLTSWRKKVASAAARIVRFHRKTSRFTSVFSSML